MLQESCINYSKTKLTNRDYGRYRYKGVMQLAHRIAYVEHHQISIEDIKDKVIRHTCDNPRCINPEHLLIGTQRDNIQDMVNRKRFNPLRGESHPNTPLTIEQVRVIRKNYKAGCRVFGYSALARKYNTTDVTIRNIVKGKTWGSML